MAQKDVDNKIPIYKLKTTNEIMKYYDEWGIKNKYDQDMVDWNYTGPKESVNVFKKYALNKNIKILDAGCGTGLVGAELKKYNYINIDGADLSKKLLDLVPKGYYKKLKQTDVKEVYQNIVFKKEISLWTTVAGGMTILFLGLEAFVPACPDYSEKGYTDEWECKYAENPGTETLNSLAWISLIGGGIMWGYYDSELKEYDNLKITYSPKYNSKNLYLVFKF